MLRALTIVLIFFCSGGYAQIKGDSVRIETLYSKNYIGTISKVEKEGYFIKVNNLREIFLPLTEIKFINKINTELEKNLKLSTIMSNIFPLITLISLA